MCMKHKVDGRVGVGTDHHQLPDPKFVSMCA